MTEVAHRPSATSISTHPAPREDDEHDSTGCADKARQHSTESRQNPLRHDQDHNETGADPNDRDSRSAQEVAEIIHG
jgi:hypothetical protein